MRRLVLEDSETRQALNEARVCCLAAAQCIRAARQALIDRGFPSHHEMCDSLIELSMRIDQQARRYDVPK